MCRVLSIEITLSRVLWRGDIVHDCLYFCDYSVLSHFLQSVEFGPNHRPRQRILGCSPSPPGGGPSKSAGSNHTVLHSGPEFEQPRGHYGVECLAVIHERHPSLPSRWEMAVCRTWAMATSVILLVQYTNCRGSRTGHFLVFGDGNDGGGFEAGGQKS